MSNLKAVLQRPKVARSLPRNAFDRSCSVNFSYQLGALDCFYGDAFTAGSHIKLNRSIFQRTADVNTAAFPKIDTHVEFFAVPIRLLWCYWNNFKLNIQDFNSSMMGSVVASSQQFTPVTPYLPFFDLHDVLKDINNCHFDQNYTNSPYFPYAQGSAELDSATTGAARLLAGLGYGQYPYSNQNDHGTTVFAVNPLKLLAYQKVYYDHFRNTAYESNDPSYYNIDRFYTQTEMPKLSTGKLLTYRYVNYRKDYMQSVYPALNYTVSSPNGINWVIPDSVLFSSGYTPVSTVYSDQSVGGQTVIRSGQVSSSSAASGANVFQTVQQIRAAFALDKLLRASAYTPKHVKDQFEARYGVKNVESGNESIRVAAFMNDILIQEVVSTTATSRADLGQVGGKGVGYGSPQKDVEFTFKEDSILIGVCYSLPRSSYDATQVAKWNSKLDREDFFIPEFMDLGLQPFENFENTFMNVVAGAWQPDWVSASGTSAYKDRYSEYKIGIDRNLGNFIKGQPLSDFVVHSNQELSSFSYAVNANYFKVKPTDMDSIFVQQTKPFDPTTDKFITHMDIRVICNQDMSIHGQPSI